MLCSYPTLNYTKALLLVGKTEGNTALVRIIKVECFERIILENLATFLKTFKIISR